MPIQIIQLGLGSKFAWTNTADGSLSLKFQDYKDKTYPTTLKRKNYLKYTVFFLNTSAPLAYIAKSASLVWLHNTNHALMHRLMLIFHVPFHHNKSYNRK